MIGYFASAHELDRRAYISNAKIQLILEAPAKFYARYGEGIEKKRSAAMVEGEILHEAVLRPQNFEKRIQLHSFKDFRTNAAKEWRDTRPIGSLIMDQEELDGYRMIVDRVWESALNRSLLEGADNERHGYARDPITGKWLYSRPDFRTTDGIIGELKFVASAAHDEFMRQQFFEGWYIQGSFYNTVDGIIRGEHKFQNFLYIAVEKEYPYVSQVYPLGEKYEFMAEKKIVKGLHLIDKHMKLDPALTQRHTWTGYFEGAKALNPTYSQIASDPDFSELIEIGGR